MKRDDLQLGAEVWVRRSSYAEYAATVAALEPWYDHEWSHGKPTVLPDGREVPASLRWDERRVSNGQGVLVTVGDRGIFRVVQLRQIIGLATPIREERERQEAAKQEQNRQYQVKLRAAEEAFFGTAEARQALGIDSAWLERGDTPTVRVSVEQFVALIQKAGG